MSGRRRPDRPLGPALLLAVALGLSGCVSPATGASSYEGKGANSAGAAHSEVATAALVVDQVLHDRLPKAYADETVSANEAALGSIADSFGNVQPPSESDQVRTEVADLIDEAGSTVADARIAVRRGDDPELRRLLTQLRRLADALAALEERLS